MGRFNNLHWDLHRSLTGFARKTKTPAEAAGVRDGVYHFDEEIHGMSSEILVNLCTKP